MIDPATFNRRVVIEQPVQTTDDQGGQSVSWQPVGSEIWASVLPTTGKEAYTWGRVLAEVQYVVKIRYRAGIKPSMRVVYAGRLLTIASVIDPDERGRFLVLGCTENI